MPSSSDKSNHALAERANVSVLEALAADCPPDELLRRVTGDFGRLEGIESAVVLCGRQGVWNVLAHAGSDISVPLDLAVEALDAEQPRLRDRWAAAPLSRPARDGRILALRMRGGRAEPLAAVESLARLLGIGLQIARLARRRAGRIERLEALLQIAARWHEHRQTAALLEEMAEAATRLIGAQRASIFLWNRGEKVLLGRPALGIEGGELRIAEDAGVVGKVVQSGEPIRVGRHDSDGLIDRSVDRQSGFHTETILCVPIRQSDGKMLGAFELLNRLEGDFTDEDEAALQELALHAAGALENTRQWEQLLRRRRLLADQAARDVELIGNCEAIRSLRTTIARVAETDLVALILGENGTGKEVVSRMIHYQSPRRDEPFLAVNCAALTETLLESELFGHEAGAFTDARETRPGKFELAGGGTLFLDEIGELSPGGQAKLLRVLEEKVVVRVGGTGAIPTDARVVAATNRDLAEMVREKRFRQDLFFRLNVIALSLPPLRERGDDILLLAEHFLRQFCLRAGRPVLELSPETRRRLLEYDWPGNVRELRNLAERLAFLAQGSRVEPDELAFLFTSHAASAEAVPEGRSLAEATRQFQRDYIHRVVKSSGGNMSEAAKRLGLHRSNFYRKLQSLEEGESAD